MLSTNVTSELSSKLSSMSWDLALQHVVTSTGMSWLLVCLSRIDQTTKPLKMQPKISLTFSRHRLEPISMSGLMERKLSHSLNPRSWSNSKIGPDLTTTTKIEKVRTDILSTTGKSQRLSPLLDGLTHQDFRT